MSSKHRSSSRPSSKRRSRRGWVGVREFLAGTESRGEFERRRGEMTSYVAYDIDMKSLLAVLKSSPHLQKIACIPDWRLCVRRPRVHYTRARCPPSSELDVRAGVLRAAMQVALQRDAMQKQSMRGHVLSIRTATCCRHASAIACWLRRCGATAACSVRIGC